MRYEELGRQAERASASSALPPPSSSRVVNKCGAVSQSSRLQQEETGLNRCEQLPTAALLSLRIHCATPQSLLQACSWPPAAALALRRLNPTGNLSFITNLRGNMFFLCINFDQRRSSGYSVASLLIMESNLLLFCSLCFAWQKKKTLDEKWQPDQTSSPAQIVDGLRLSLLTISSYY